MLIMTMVSKAKIGTHLPKNQSTTTDVRFHWQEEQMVNHLSLVKGRKEPVTVGSSSIAAVY